MTGTMGIVTKLCNAQSGDCMLVSIPPRIIRAIRVIVIWVISVAVIWRRVKVWRIPVIIGDPQFLPEIDLPDIENRVYIFHLADESLSRTGKYSCDSDLSFFTIDYRVKDVFPSVQGQKSFIGDPGRFQIPRGIHRNVDRLYEGTVLRECCTDDHASKDEKSSPVLINVLLDVGKPEIIGPFLHDALCQDRGTGH